MALRVGHGSFARRTARSGGWQANGGLRVGRKAYRCEHRLPGRRRSPCLLWRHPWHGGRDGSRLDRHLRRRRKRKAAAQHRIGRRFGDASAGSFDRGRSSPRGSREGAAGGHSDRIRTGIGAVGRPPLLYPRSLRPAGEHSEPRLTAAPIRTLPRSPSPIDLGEKKGSIGPRGGAMAEWSGSGLQIRVPGFDSRSRLQNRSEREREFFQTSD